MLIPLNKKDILYISLLGVYCAFLFRDIIIGGHLLSGPDFISFYLGMKQFLYDEITIHHTIPYWNPYIFGGLPFLAHFESTIFYPLGALFWVLPPEKAYGYTMFIHMLFAGLFMYILARDFFVSRLGSLVAGAVFISNGFIMAMLNDGQMCRVQSYPWIPLIIYVLNNALKSNTFYFGGTIAGLLWGIQILSGAPQDAFYTFISAVLFLGINVKYNFKKFFNYNLKIFAIAVLLFFFGAGVSAIQIIPAFEFIGHSVRSALDSYDLVTMGSYPPEGIITTIMPHFFGSYIKDNFWVSGIPWSVPSYNLYVGIPTIILAFFIIYRNPENKKIIIFTVSLAIVAFILALGSHTPVYKLISLLPGFNRIRAPAKIIVLWVFAMGLLAGKGIDNLFNHSRVSLMKRTGLCLCFVISFVVLEVLLHVERSSALKILSPFILDEAIPDKMGEAINIICNEFYRSTSLSILTILPILLWIRGVMRPKLSAVFICIILLVDLAHVNVGAIQHDDKIYLSIKKIKHELNVNLGKDKSIYRVGSYKSGLQPNIEMYLGYQTVGGYTPFFLHRYYEYINHYKYYKSQIPKGWVVFFYETNENSELMDLLNVKYEISHTLGEIRLRKTYLPRAFIVSDYKILKKEEILDYLIRSEYNPTRTVLFENDDFRPYFHQYPLPKQRLTGQAKIISYRPDSIVISTDSSGPGFLFLSEIFYPGWHAFIDEKPTQILRGNYLFRVIELPKGRHMVHLVFDPLSIKIGIGITIFTLLMLLIILIYHFRKNLPFFGHV